MDEERLFDALRFSGDVDDRMVFHRPSLTGGTSNALFSFDNPGDWTSTNAVTRTVTGTVTQGTSALGAVSPGYGEIVSRGFSTDDLASVTDHLSIDVFVPVQQPNPYWTGALQAYLSCTEAGIYNLYLGEQDLTPLFKGEFNTVELPLLPPIAVAALETPGMACALKLALNVNAGSGEYLLDNLAFR